MKNLIFYYIFLFSSLIDNNINAQDMYSLTYEYTSHIGNMSESKLIIQNHESVFKIFYKKQGEIINEDGTLNKYVLDDELGTFMYSNDFDNYVRTPFRKSKGGTAYVYKKGAVKWELTGGAKIIKEYSCQEALVTLNGRSFSVWFTPEIPINKGPLKINGLPGLIIEVKEKNGFCKLSLLKIKKSDEDQKLFNDIKKYFREYPVLQYDEYEKIVKKLLLPLKIRLAKRLAEDRHNGYEVEFTFPNGDYYFVKSIIDIPRGMMEELNKINL